MCVQVQWGGAFENGGRTNLRRRAEAPSRHPPHSASGEVRTPACELVGTRTRGEPSTPPGPFAQPPGPFANTEVCSACAPMLARVPNAPCECCERPVPVHVDLHKCHLAIVARWTLARSVRAKFAHREKWMCVRVQGLAHPHGCETFHGG